MTNADSGGAVISELSRRIQAAYGWDSLAQPAPRGYKPPVVKPEVQVAGAILETYVGEYALPDMTLSVTLEGGRLHAQATGPSKLRLSAESDDTFFAAEVNARLTFTKGPSGAVTGLVLDQGGRKTPAKKVR